MTPQEYIRSRADAVFNGEANAATVYAELYALSKELESAIATVKEQAITEVKQYGREGLTSNGYNFTTSNAGGRWNYSGVSVLTSLTERIKKVQVMVLGVPSFSTRRAQRCAACDQSALSTLWLSLT